MRHDGPIRFYCRENAIFERNVRAAAALGLPCARAGERIGGRCVIVGTGPSLDRLETVAALGALQAAGWAVVALKEALRILPPHGIAPRLTVAMDGGGDQIAKVPNMRGVVYYLASSCHPAVYDHLANRDIRVFHSRCGFAGEAGLYRALFDEPAMMSGGVTVANRAFALMRFLGFAEIALAGCDFGWRGDDWKIYAEGATGRTKSGAMRMRDRGMTDGREWFSRPDLLVSAIEIAREVRAGNCRIVGDSLAAALARHDEAYCDALMRAAA